MGLAGVPTQRNLVIASVQTSGGTTPVFQDSDIPPYTRPNGGDLVRGDYWYSTENDFLYMWSGNAWVAIGGEGMYELLLSLVERVEELEKYAVDYTIIDAGTAFVKEPR